MGWTSESVCISVQLSSHNSPKDDYHRKLWDEVTIMIQDLIDSPRYKEILLDWSVR